MGHTKGTWFSVPNDDKGVFIYSEDQQEGAIARVYSGTEMISKEEGMANATLIIQSPQLLKHGQNTINAWNVYHKDRCIENRQALENCLKELQDIIIYASGVDPKNITDVEFEETVFTKEWPGSSSVKSTTYNRTLRVLTVVFVRGETYNYQDVLESVWAELVGATSIGTFVARQIKGKYICK